VEKNVVERDILQMTIWRMRITCRVPKATNTHTQYIILIAIPQQQWLHERASMLHYTYTACIVAFQNMVDGFHGIRLTAISHTALRTVWPSVRRFSRNS
jgi:hypothetical protein